MLYDLETSTIGLRRGWSVSRALSWAVCFADKTRAHGNLPQVWLIEGCACAGSAVNAANPSSTRVNASSAIYTCLDPAQISSRSTKPALRLQQRARRPATRAADDRAGRRKAMRIGQRCGRASMNAWARRRPTWGGRARQAQQIHARRWTRRRKYTLPWNGSTCGACRRARTCVQRLARAPLAHAALADAHAKRQFPADGCTVIEWLLRHDASAC